MAAEIKKPPLVKPKQVVKVIKLQIPAGKANPAPPIGPALGSAGVNIMAFCKDFNEKTKDQIGNILPTIIYVGKDKTFAYETRKPPVAEFLKKELGIQKGSAVPNRDKVGKITLEQATKIAAEKKENMNAGSLEAAIKIVVGTARSMGIDFVGG